jgi:hypothetical protein
MMSRTEIYKVKTNGDTTFYGEAPNSWGYGALVWDVLGKKYVDSNFVLFNDSLFNKLFELFEYGDIKERDRIVLGSTSDYVYIAKQNIPKLIEALKSFYNEYGNDKVPTILVTAKILEKMLKEPDTRGCAFNMTSVSNPYWEEYDSVTDSYSPRNIDTDTKVWELFEVMKNG